MIRICDFVIARDKANPRSFVTSDIFPQRKDKPNVNDHLLVATGAATLQTGGLMDLRSVTAHSNSKSADLEAFS